MENFVFLGRPFGAPPPVRFDHAANARSQCFRGEREWNCTYTFVLLSLHFCCTSVPALRRPVRPSLSGEPDVMRRTVSPRCSTANSRRPRTAAPIWWPSATIHPSPLPGFCGTRRTGRRIRGPDSLPSPLRVFDLPVSSRVRQPVWFCGWQTRMIITCTVVIQACIVIFSARVL